MEPGNTAGACRRMGDGLIGCGQGAAGTRHAPSLRPTPPLASPPSRIIRSSRRHLVTALTARPVPLSPFPAAPHDSVPAPLPAPPPSAPPPGACLCAPSAQVITLKHEAYVAALPHIADSHRKGQQVRNPVKLRPRGGTRSGGDARPGSGRPSSGGGMRQAIASERLPVVYDAEESEAEGEGSSNGTDSRWRRVCGWAQVGSGSLRQRFQFDQPDTDAW